MTTPAQLVFSSVAGAPHAFRIGTVLWEGIEGSADRAKTGHWARGPLRPLRVLRALRGAQGAEGAEALRALRALRAWQWHPSPRLQAWSAEIPDILWPLLAGGPTQRPATRLLGLGR